VTRVVVVAEYLLPADLLMEALRDDRYLEVTRVVGDRDELKALAVQEVLAAAQILVYVPERRIRSIAWWEEKFHPDQVLVLVDLFGQVGLERALQLGAQGYISPQETSRALLHHVTAVIDGALATTHSELAEVHTAVRRLGYEEIRRRRLTTDQLNLMQWIGRGETAEEIAVRLGLRPHAVRSRIRRLRERLGARNEAEVAGLAGQWGLLTSEGSKYAEIETQRLE
jgi:DNA-binding NarL/FixJ family response regulator